MDYILKKYTQPSIELTKFDVEDVIMASGKGSLGAGTTVDKAAATADLKAAGYTVVEW